MLHLELFLEKYFLMNEKVILACSCGPDSIFLLYEILKTKYSKNLVVCYFNHKIRTQADEEEKYIKNLSKELNFKIEIGVSDIKEIINNKTKSISLEELAREKRYEFFKKIIKKYNTNKIITAHHLDDRIETFLFNLLRGSKLTGLINMTYYNGFIIRPLLNVEKTQILNYLDKNNIKYFIDETNFDNNITRNYIRNDIIPRFPKINKKFKTHIKNTIEYLDDMKDYIDDEIKDFLYGKNKENSFLITDFKNKNLFIQKEIIRYIFNKTNNNSNIGLSNSNILEIIRFINGKNNNTVKVIKKLNMKKKTPYIFY